MRIKGLALIGLLAWAPLLSQEKVVRGFVNFDITSSSGEGQNPHVALGQFDTYITGQIIDKFTYLGELVVEYDDGWIIDLERLWLKYEHSQALSLSIGKFHTPLGYWNREYHHGLLLHTTMDRPLFLLFEDEGGILPIHTTGILISGEEIGPASLYYDVMIGNGIGSSPTDDNNSNKSYGVYLHSQAINGLDFGFTVYSDYITEGSEVDAHINSEGEVIPLEEDIDQQIFGGNLAYYRSNWEFLLEYVVANNEGQETMHSQDTTASYVLVSYNVKKWTPFFRYDSLEVKDGDPFYFPTDIQAVAVGLKYDFSYLITTKLQYTNKKVSATGTENTFGIQFAVGF